ncbi:MAG: GNAT family N-acetyltransferase [Thermoleophilaceae bacterium]|nr:GNAT family N-acetyltransferase [Thermoleophilaceae bacterium]
MGSEDAGGAGFRPAPLAGKHVALRPLRPDDYPALARWEGQLGVRWRVRGMTPAPDDWMRRLWQGVLVQFMVLNNEGNVVGDNIVGGLSRTERQVGLVVVYDADFLNGYAKLAAARFDPGAKGPHLVFGVGLTLHYVFTHWNLRKLYLEIPEFNLPQFDAGWQELFEPEGTLREHRFYDGRYWDEHTFAIYRDRFYEFAGDLLADGLSAREVTVRLPEERAPAG